MTVTGWSHDHWWTWPDWLHVSVWTFTVQVSFHIKVLLYCFVWSQCTWQLVRGHFYYRGTVFFWFYWLPVWEYESLNDTDNGEKPLKSNSLKTSSACAGITGKPLRNVSKFGTIVLVVTWQVDVTSCFSCPSVPFLWTWYLRNTSREFFLQIWLTIES